MSEPYQKEITFNSGISVYICSGLVDQVVVISQKCQVWEPAVTLS